MKAVIYARVSSVSDRQNTDRQVSDLNRYAEAMGMDIIGIYTEHISGAKKNNEREVFQEAIQHCMREADIMLVSELSRLGRNAFEVLDTVKEFIYEGKNLYMQKEQFTLLDENGKPSLFAPVMIATLSTCAQLERENIKFRLNSGREQYIAKGGKLGRKEGSIKTTQKKKEEYKDVIKDLKKGIAMRKVATLNDVSLSTVQRIKKEFSI